jgi:hypothetical protein
VGKARASADARVIAMVGQEPITVGDFQEKVKVVETNLEYMKGQISEGSPSSPFLQAYIAIIEEAGVYNVALAGLIQEKALYQHALANGYEATEQEITAQVERQQSLIATDVQGIAPAKAYIEAVGEERYWSELYPAKAKRELSIQKMWADVVAGARTNQERTEKWNQLQKEVITNTKVELLDPEAVEGATVEGALAYLNDYWQLEQ